MNWFVILPFLIPFTAAAILLTIRSSIFWQRLISLLSSIFLLLSTLFLLFIVLNNGIQVVQIGNWPAPFGISFTADLLSVIMVVITGIVALAVGIYARANIDEAREHYGYHPLYQILCAALCGAFLTGDLFNLYVWFEVLLIASFVLLALGSEKRQLKGSLNYVLINLVASSFFLSATGLLYGLTGALNMADLALQIPNAPQHLVTAVAMLFLVAFGMKAAIFPLFFWLPAAYPAPPVAIAAFFAGILTKVGVYALVRVFTMLFVHDTAYSHTILLYLAAITILVGVLGAIIRDNLLEILSFHVIAQVGYMLVGLALLSYSGLQATVFYFLEDIIVVTSLFLIGGIAYKFMGSFSITHLGGFYKHKPLLSILFLICGLSIAGFPPFSGFWAKLFIIQASLESEAYFIAFVLIVGALITIFSITRIWQAVFWTPAEDEGPLQKRLSLKRLYLPVVTLAILTLTISFWPSPFYKLAGYTAEQLLQPEQYGSAVFKESK